MGVSPDRVKLAAYDKRSAFRACRCRSRRSSRGGSACGALGWETDAIAGRHGRNVSRRGERVSTLAGVLLLGMMYNLLNLGDHYPMVAARGGFLLLVVIFQQRIAQRKQGW